MTKLPLSVLLSVSEFAFFSSQPRFGVFLGLPAFQVNEQVGLIQMCKRKCWRNQNWRCIVLFLATMIVTCIIFLAPLSKKTSSSSLKPTLKPRAGADEGKHPQLCKTPVSMNESRYYADAFVKKMVANAWVTGERYTPETLAALAYRQNMFLWRAFEMWRNISSHSRRPIACNYWTVFRNRYRFQVRWKYLQSGEGSRYRKTCRKNNQRASPASARARGGRACPFKNVVKERHPHVIRSDALSARGRFDPFVSPVGKMAFGWKKSAKSCAVVGSSPRLLGRKLGNDIDAHDLVIRFNTAVVEGREVDLGSRTDVRITSKNRIFYEDCDEIVLTKKKNSMASLTSQVLPMEPIFYMADPARCSHRRHGMRKHKRPVSSGYRGVCLALDMCEHISVYGFSVPSSEGKFNATYHVDSPYDNCPKNVQGTCRRGGHAWMAEYQHRMKLNEKKLVCLPDVKAAIKPNATGRQWYR